MLALLPLRVKLLDTTSILSSSFRPGAFPEVFPSDRDFYASVIKKMRAVFRLKVAFRNIRNGQVPAVNLDNTFARDRKCPRLASVFFRNSFSLQARIRLEAAKQTS